MAELCCTLEKSIDAVVSCRPYTASYKQCRHRCIPQVSLNSPLTPLKRHFSQLTTARCCNQFMKSNTRVSVQPNVFVSHLVVHAAVISCDSSPPRNTGRCHAERTDSPKLERRQARADGHASPCRTGRGVGQPSPLSSPPSCIVVSAIRIEFEVMDLFRRVQFHRF